MIPLRDDNPHATSPVVTIGFIAICVLVFLWQVSLGPTRGEQIVYALGAIPSVLLGRNMLYLWIFGDNVEDSMGRVRFVVFYLLCGLAAVLAQALPDPNSTVPMVGASGAISGVLGAYLLLYPHARVLVVIPIGFILQTARIPAGIVLVLWFGLQLLSNAMATGDGGGVAFRAHIGGFIAGMALIPLFKQKRVRLWAPRRYQ